jgi:hypothetical protein
MEDKFELAGLKSHELFREHALRLSALTFVFGDIESALATERGVHAASTSDVIRIRILDPATKRRKRRAPVLQTWPA